MGVLHFEKKKKKINNSITLAFNELQIDRSE